MRKFVVGGFGAVFKTILGGDPVEGVTKLINQFKESPEQKIDEEKFLAELQAQRDQIAAARDQALDDIAGQNIRAETTSADKYTARARPTFLYIIEAVLGFNYILLPAMQFSMGRGVAPILLPSDLLWLFGACVLGYTGARSLDKFMSLPGESKIDLPLVKMSNVSPKQ
jgi:hypothetical protein